MCMQSTCTIYPLFQVLVLLGINMERMSIMIIYKTKIFSSGLQKSFGGCILPGRGKRREVSDLHQSSANSGLQVKSSPLPLFDNEAGLEHSHTHLQLLW